MIDAYGWQTAGVAPLAGGLINATYAVHDGERPIAVLQRLHPVFGAAVNLDLEAVTTHLAARGLATPHLVRTRGGDAWIEHDGRIWRALTWVDGITVHRVPDPSWAEAAGELVGRFHVAMTDFTYEYRFVRAGVHDTAAHLARLGDAVEASSDADAVSLGREVLAAAASLPPMPALPQRHCHGDLKISNVLFGIPPSMPINPQPVRGHSLVDLDTVGLGTIAFELGDAMRSWCNPHGEDAGAVRFDLPIFAFAIRGFLRAAGAVVSTEERVSIVTGLETVCIELAARFAVDVFRNDYFGWDATRFPSRRAHNIVRARGQLALGEAVRCAREDALRIVRG
ncbi:MAG TPA: phosphotransferase [Kofleriaceae bacterium]|nr:phosphotransferase [Kofleriaceae bacterium]